MGERGGTGEVASSARAPSPQMSAVSRVSEPAWSGGEGEPESESRTQMPESKLRLDWLPPPPPPAAVLAGPEVAMVEMSGSLRWLRLDPASAWGPEPDSSISATVASTASRCSAPDNVLYISLLNVYCIVYFVYIIY